MKVKRNSVAQVIFFPSLTLPLQRLNSLLAPASNTHKTISSDDTYTFPTSPSILTCSSPPLLPSPAQRFHPDSLQHSRKQICLSDVLGGGAKLDKSPAVL